MVNLALFDLNKKLSAGDQSTEPKTEETDVEETDYSMGDGDLLSQPKVQDSRLGRTENEDIGEPRTLFLQIPAIKYKIFL